MKIKKQIEEKWKALKDSIRRFMDWKFFRLFLLIFVAVVELAAIYHCWECIEGIFRLGKEGNPRLTNILPILFAAPVALLIWYWRDQNKRADIETARADLLQKDFHKIEEWATESDGVLQVAAIHQLHPYATGANGKVFKKPASEIYKALLSAWGKRVEDDLKRLSQKQAEAEASVIQIKPPPHIKAIHKIVKKDWSDFPDDFLPWIYLGYADLIDADLRHADLLGADLCHAYLRGTDLSYANLEGTNFRHTVLVRTSLRCANLSHASFLGVTMLEADLAEANLEGAVLVNTDLVGADLREADLVGAAYSEGTKFPEGFNPKEHRMELGPEEGWL